MSVIDLATERGKRDRPDDQFIRDDGEGRALYLYWADFTVDGEPHQLDIWAYDFGHAEAQIGAMRDSLTLLGQAMAVVE